MKKRVFIVALAFMAMVMLFCGCDAVKETHTIITEDNNGNEISWTTTYDSDGNVIGRQKTIIYKEAQEELATVYEEDYNQSEYDSDWDF